MAKRLGNIALTKQLISPLHLAGRPAVDAAATLTHDVEKAFQNQDIITALAFDIRGAFDCVSKHRLVNRLWEQNIPLNLVRWARSFLEDRTAAIRLTGYKYPFVGKRDFSGFRRVFVLPRIIFE